MCVASVTRHPAPMAETFPFLRAVVLDTRDARRLAEFYRQLLGYSYRPGDEPPPDCQPDERGADYVVLRSPDGTSLAFQQEPEMVPSTWPDHSVPQQVHLDMSVASPDDLVAQRDRVVALGGRLLLDRFDDPEEPLYVFADLAGHPFCIFVADRDGPERCSVGVDG